VQLWASNECSITTLAFASRQVVSHVRFEGDAISPSDLRASYDACVEAIGDTIRILREVCVCLCVPRGALGTYHVGSSGVFVA
jgi:hypothetical protein